MSSIRVISHVQVEQLELLAQKQVPGLEFIHIDPAAEPAADLRGDLLLTSALGGANLQQLLDGDHGIRWVHVMGTGIDQFPIHLVKHAQLTCSRGATAIPIAEWAMAMLLAHAKQLPASWVEQPPAEWFMAPLSMLAGKTLGLVGYGSIGQAIATRARAFDMDVQALVRSPRQGEPGGVRFVDDIGALMTSSDCVVLAAPATAETHHLINAESLAAARPDMHLVNVARGSLVDEAALKVALDEERIGMASLDVVEGEPLTAGHWMYTHPKVKLSAHVSWNSPTAFSNMILYFVRNLRHFSLGEPLDGVVDIDAGY